MFKTFMAQLANVLGGNFVYPTRSSVCSGKALFLLAMCHWLENSLARLLFLFLHKLLVGFPILLMRIIVSLLWPHTAGVRWVWGQRDECPHECVWVCVYSQIKLTLGAACPFHVYDTKAGYLKFFRRLSHILYMHWPSNINEELSSRQNLASNDCCFCCL